MKQKTIFMNLEGYVYLCSRQRTERGYEVNQSNIDFWTKVFEKENRDGFIDISDKGLGGGIGSTNWNTWTSWSVEDMAKMLNEKKLPYKFGERDVIYI